LKEKRAWDLAISPAKSLPMQAFMLYMSGGGVQIFSMGIVLMLLLTPFKNILGINAAFAPFAPTSSNANSLETLPLQKLAYVACNLLTLAVGLWKCRSMGLLPTGWSRKEINVSSSNVTVSHGDASFDIFSSPNDLFTLPFCLIYP
ncbi:hypothetical protein PAXINDRAFT_73780, partial [Paxillus involutus ATCC 200175]